MDLLKQTKRICEDNGIKPARSKGQNFLIAEKIYDEIVEAAELTKNDFVLEVGPGLGFLTEKLSAHAGNVMAVELDDKLAQLAGKRLKEQGISNVEVVNKNVLDVVGRDELPVDYKVVANLPYNITSIFLRKVFESKTKPKMMVLMLQKEVAERIAAVPGKMSLLAVSVLFYSEAEIVRRVGKENFWPAPEVDSAVLKLKIKNEELRIKNIDEKDFFRLVKIGFSAKRKMLKNNLANGFHITDEEATTRIIRAGFKASVRAQELSVEDWVGLFGIFMEIML
jgi:16S rRNA (adenine1518-N6/adenine1519-N6)-dimethyltransferase